MDLWLRVEQAGGLGQLGTCGTWWASSTVGLPPIPTLKQMPIEAHVSAPGSNAGRGLRLPDGIPDAMANGSPFFPSQGTAPPASPTQPTSGPAVPKAVATPETQGRASNGESQSQGRAGQVEEVHEEVAESGQALAGCRGTQGWAPASMGAGCR